MYISDKLIEWTIKNESFYTPKPSCQPIPQEVIIWKYL